MRKLRGQFMIYGLVVIFLMLMIYFAFLPTLGDQANSAVSNTTLFPAGGMTSVLTKMIPFFMGIGILLIFFTYASFQRGQ